MVELGQAGKSGNSERRSSTLIYGRMIVVLMLFDKFSETFRSVLILYVEPDVSYSKALDVSYIIKS